MSTYEELSIIINVAILIVAILVYSMDKGAKKIITLPPTSTRIIIFY